MKAKKPKPRKKTGRPTRWNQKTRDILKMAARKGFTHDEMALVLGIKVQTLYNWKKKHPKFFDAIKDWKYSADADVERSLYERALGYEHRETKAQFVNGGPDGLGGWETIDLVKHYPPDPTSMIFWLKNRQPDRWRDKRDHTLSNPDGGPVIFNIEGVDPGDKPKDTK